MTKKPIVSFDTSAVNHLADDAEVTALTAGLRAGFSIRINMTVIEEISGTQSQACRTKLLKLCQQLFAAGDCIYPYYWILENLITAYVQHEGPFDWTSVNVECPEAIREVAFQENVPFDDELASSQKAYASSQKKAFSEIFAHRRADLATHFQQKPTEQNLPEFVARLQKPNGPFWRIATELFERGAKASIGSVSLTTFVESCPPFLAVVHAICVAEYEHRERDMKIEQSLRAGPFDLYMSACLPYCDQFVTAEERQARALQQVVTGAKLNVEVVLYSEFRKRLLI